MSKKVYDIIDADSIQELDQEQKSLLGDQVARYLQLDEKAMRSVECDCSHCANGILMQYSDEPVFCFCQEFNNRQTPDYWCESWKQSRRAKKIQKRYRYITDIYLN